MSKRIRLAILALVAIVPTVWAAETAFELVGCGIAKRVPLESSPEITVFGYENWAINTSTATKGWENATKHCVSYVRILEGKPTVKGACKWLDATGDSAIFELETLPSGANTLVWLSGTGKYKGIKGGGSFAMVASGKPRG
jgi:hypothetical protein